MSISAAIANAVSGLTAASRGTEIVSTNIANSQTEGYARRELELSSRLYERGGGVVINGIDRIVNAGLLADSRLSQAQLGASDTIAQFHRAMENVVGTATEASSLGGSLTAFNAALTNAAARPDSDVRLSAVVDTATALANKINKIADDVQSARTDAERTIANDVSRLNSALERVASLNKQIAALSAQGKDASSQMDARQAAIDSISEIVPLETGAARQWSGRPVHHWWRHSSGWDQTGKHRVHPCWPHQSGHESGGRHAL
jgi:flagellar hook-associated protein 1 FlgK